jgi:hypothetical protein
MLHEMHTRLTPPILFHACFWLSEWSISGAHNDQARPANKIFGHLHKQHLPQDLSPSSACVLVVFNSMWTVDGRVGGANGTMGVCPGRGRGKQDGPARDSGRVGTYTSQSGWVIYSIYIHTHDIIYEEVEGPPYMVTPPATGISGPTLHVATGQPSTYSDPPLPVCGNRPWTPI